MKAWLLAALGASLLFPLAACNSLLGLDNRNEEDCPFADSCTDAATTDSATMMDSTVNSGETSVDSGDSSAVHPDAADSGSPVMNDAGEDAQDSGSTVGDSAPPMEAGCPTGTLTCDGGCVPNDTHNCGTCGHDCNGLPNVSGQVVCGASGACEFDAGACAPGFAHCTGGSPDQGCETPIDTPANCGACGMTCSGGTPNCAGSGSAYSCTSGCPAGTPTLCGSTCVDTTSDSQNCMTCGNACTTQVQHATAVCKNSACGYNCNANFTPCNGGCADFSSDNNNCGGCGNVCGAGTSCNSGMCVCNAGTNCNGCCAGNTCEAFGSQSTASCGSGGGACGACSVTGEVCANVSNGGACQCPAGDSACGGTCVNTSSDPGNCGTCGNVCSSHLAGSSCSGGNCVCPNGDMTCNGTCVNVMGTDAANCGACGHSCLGGTCVAGACQPVELAPPPSPVTGISGLTTDGTTVYWLGTFPNGDGMGGEVLSCLGTGCNQTATVVVSTEGPGQLVTAGGSLYWPTITAGPRGTHSYVIQTCKIGSCTSSTPVATTASPTGGLATDGTSLYWWFSASMVDFCRISSCSPASFNGASAGGNLPYTIAVGNSNVYWIDSGNVYYCGALGIACSNPAATNPTGGATVVTADGSNVYWADSTGVKQCAGGFPGCKTGTAPVALASVAQSANSIASDGTYVYWTTSANTIVRAKVGVANSSMIIAQNQSGAANIAVGSQAVYWSVTGAAVMALAK